MSVTSFGQTLAERQSAKRKVALLREYLNLPSSTPITVPKQKTFPSVSPLKVYVLTKYKHKGQMQQNVQAYNNLIGWFDEWNQKEGAYYGRIEPVSDVSLSDIVLVYVMDIDQAAKEAHLKNQTIITVPLYMFVANRKKDELEMLFTEAWDVAPTTPKEAGAAIHKFVVKLMKERRVTQQ
jgi:hypothetical protein